PECDWRVCSRASQHICRNVLSRPGTLALHRVSTKALGENLGITARSVAPSRDFEYGEIGSRRFINERKLDRVDLQGRSVSGQDVFGAHSLKYLVVRGQGDFHHPWHSA